MRNLERVVTMMVTEGNTEKTITQISLATRLPVESVETVLRANPAYFQRTDEQAWRLSPSGLKLGSQPT